MKIRGWRRELAQDMKMPLGYGLAWVDWSRQVAVCYPRPVNRLAQQWREFVWRLTRAACAFGGPGPEEQQVADAQRIYRERQVLAEEFATGYLTGWQECIDACVETIEQQVESGGLRTWCSLPAKTGCPKTQADPHADKLERTKLN